MVPVRHLSLPTALALTLMARAAVADEPPGDPTALAAAPHADEASGIAVQSPETDHSVVNGALAVPRTLALILLAGPRYAPRRSARAGPA